MDPRNYETPLDFLRAQQERMGLKPSDSKIDKKDTPKRSRTVLYTALAGAAVIATYVGYNIYTKNLDKTTPTQPTSQPFQTLNR